MASASPNRWHTSSAGGSASSVPPSGSPPSGSPHRKVQALGGIIILLAVLLGTAFLTYHPNDDAVARHLPLLDALAAPHDHQAVYRIQNALGLAGAKLARHLLRGFVGYVVLIPTGVLLLGGYVLLRHQTLAAATIRRLVHASGLALVAAGGLAPLFGWAALAFDAASLQVWAGRWGMSTARLLQSVAGLYGALLLLVALGTLALLVAADANLQRSARRFAAVGQAVAAAARAVQQRAASLFDGRWSPTVWHQPAPQKALPPKARGLPESADAGRALPPSSEEATVPDAKAPAAGVLDADARPANEPVDDSRGAAAARLPQDEIDRTADPDAVPDATTGPDAAPDGLPEAPREAPYPPASAADSATAGGFEADRPQEALDAAERPSSPRPLPEDVRRQQQQVLDTLTAYNIGIADVHTVAGDAVARHELTLADRSALRSVRALADDLAVDLGHDALRVLALPSGTAHVAVELPRATRRAVSLQDVLPEGPASPGRRLPLALGRSLRRDAVVEDLAAMPHLLMVGGDEAERRAGLRALVVGLLSETTPDAVRLVAVDGATPPLPPFARLPHVALHAERHPGAHPEDHPQPHSGAKPPAKTPTPEQVLAACRQEMNVRYRLLDVAEASDHMAYNERVRRGDLRGDEGHRPLPLLVLVVATLGDVLAVPACESVLLRLAHGMPAVGMHLLVSAAAETLPRIPQALLSAIPHRIAYAMPSRVDSRAALDCRGAEALTGGGDVLYRNRPVPMRLQSPVVSAEAETHVLNVDCAPYALPCLHPSHPFLSDSSS